MSDNRPEDSPAAQLLRARLVRELEADPALFDRRVLAAIGRVPRHLFVDNPRDLDEAYANRALSIGHGQTISQPLIVAMMSQALQLTGRERVLEIGTGSAYQTAVLAELSATVYTIELVEPLAQLAGERLRALGYRNIKQRTGDGYLGWPDAAPFDRIVLTAAPEKLPTPLLEQLSEGGILVAPIGTGYAQRLHALQKTANGLTETDLGGVIFVPMVHSKATIPS